jgi:hypothetical protein
MDNQKDFFQLWFEYLRRSDDYKEFCEWYREHQKDESLPLPGKFVTLPHGLNPDPYVGLKPYILLISTFSDVYAIDFDEWRENQKDRLERINRNRGPGPIEDYTAGASSIENDINHCIDAFKQSEGREPSANELKTNFLQFLKRESDKTLLLRVDLTYEPKVIKDALRGWITSDGLKKRMMDAKSWRWLRSHRYKKPTVKQRLLELQNYLEVYDMWKEKVDNRKPGDPGGWDEIIRCLEPNWNINGDDRLSKLKVYQDYKRKAKNIISNTEQGYFPGDY